MHATSEAEVIAEEFIQFECPRCGASDAVAQQLKHVGKAYGLITVMVTTENVVLCEECGLESRSKIHPAELVSIPTDQIRDYIQPKIEFVAKFCIIISIVLCFAAMVTLPMAIYGFVSVRRKSRRWKKLAMTGLVLSALWFVVFVLVMLRETT